MPSRFEGKQLISPSKSNIFLSAYTIPESWQSNNTGKKEMIPERLMFFPYLIVVFNNVSSSLACAYFVILIIIITIYRISSPLTIWINLNNNLN